jgi:hypothetical protein
MSIDEPLRPGERPIVWVILDEVRFPSRSTLMAAIRQRIPDFIDDFPDQEDERGVVGSLDGKRCIVSFNREPNPLHPDDSCILDSWWWPDAWARLQHRKAFVVVCMIEEDDPVHRYGALANLAAAVIDTSPAIGVYWELADAVWPAAEFRDEVDQSGKDPPVRMCVSVKLAKDAEYPNPGGGPAYLGLTRGLAAFDLMEIEARGYLGKPLKLANMLLNMATYLIACGPVIGDGHTFGYEGERKFNVRHQPSTIAPGLFVYRLYLDGLEGSQGR